MSHTPFYGKKIARGEEQAYIRNVLSKYKRELANDELKKKVYDELMLLKHQGMITIPFQVRLVIDPYNRYPPYIDVVLDTKV